MMTNIRFILKALGVTVLSGLLVHNIRDLVKLVSEMRSVEQAKIEKIEDIQILIKDKKSSKGHILKLTPYYFQPLRYKINVHTAEKLKYEPNDEKILKLARKQLSNSSYFFKKRQQQLNPSNISWYARADNLKQNQWPDYHKIQKFGKIKGDIFHVKRQFQPVRYMSTWEKMSNWFYELLYKQRGPLEQSRSYSFFLGPVVGFLNYEVDLMKDSKIIVACNIQDGKIIPSVTAASKSQIMAYFKEIINQKYIQIGILTVAAAFIARWLLSDIKRQINAFKVRNSKARMKYFTMEHTPEDKQCIICYNSCRNVIFFDCRHMIMCYQCSQAYDSDICPYCKNQIDDIKPLIGIP